ncbi:MAG: histidine ammonia-lyase [Blastocatellia bacterium]|nr:histidine ammonia-lyase [Blastocatellia bacterium]MCS7157687.1 histidine ammonia-lyase [Blastocatellia bacterium]MCX7751952.1 histidine ammonia-lyase [Blastocatellia bacterium]MDW8167058.1 histidine ammonia-lyase [Acidobacteriota bacterium]MDW8257162.1 histidine ammonia-lyase [Acidobacteriota bacterium]
MIAIDGNSLTLEQLEAVAVDREPVEIAPEAFARMEASRRVVEEILRSGRVVYGVNTGFGKLSGVTIPQEATRRLQLNLVRSHAAGVGEPLGEAETRAMMLARANVLAKGYSGVRPVVVETLVGMLNAGIHPIVPSRGSVGASGDLAPLAHLALAMIGEGEVLYRGERRKAHEALMEAGIAPLQLEAKEGIALLNGTQAMVAVGALCLQRAKRLADIADVAGAMSLEALHGTNAACDPRLQAVRPHPGQREVAERILRLTEGSEIMLSHKDCPRVQDAYSLRCMPQVHGAVRDVIRHVENVVSIELNSATDNPLVFAETGDVLLGGNFHGEILALAFDYLAMALAELGAISERRIERLVNPDLSELPPFLTTNPGMCSGMMLLQIVAVSLVGENKVLAHPASVDSLPTSGNKEDHVSMGMTSALKLRQVLDNVEYILAIELLCAAQGLDYLSPLRPGRGVQMAYERLRALVSPLTEDRVLASDVERVRAHLMDFATIPI